MKPASYLKMLDKVMNKPRIVKLVDKEIMPLLDSYRKEEEPTMKKNTAAMLLTYEDIFEYHFPEDFKECKTLVSEGK